MRTPTFLSALAAAIALSATGARVQADSAGEASALDGGVALAEIPGPPPTFPRQPSNAEPSPSPTQQAPSQAGSGLLSDIKLYFTAPLRWNARDWSWFGGALLAVGAAHHYDTQVRTHFLKNARPGETFSSHDVQDILPTVGVLAATWGYAQLTSDSDGRREAWTMLEAAGLSTVTTYALKYTIGREGPDQTSDPNEWRKSGGKSFPSGHSTVAFAVGTVLAESGNDEYRWLRRLLGYGLGVATSYERLKHNTHWLSDTVAGAALGAASANFTMKRTYRTQEEAHLSVAPVEGGAMLTYRVSWP